MFQLFQPFQIQILSHSYSSRFPSLKKNIGMFQPKPNKKKEGKRKKFLSFPFQTVPESLETLDVSEGKKRSFSLGRETQNLVRVRRL